MPTSSHILAKFCHIWAVLVFHRNKRRAELKVQPFFYIFAQFITGILG